MSILTKEEIEKYLFELAETSNFSEDLKNIKEDNKNWFLDTCDIDISEMSFDEEAK